MNEAVSSDVDTPYFPVATHKLIVMSDTYRQSSRSRADALAADPANDYLWRFDMRRLTAEEIRDSVLAVTGTLNDKQYGPSVFPEIPKDVLAGQSMPGAGWHDAGFTGTREQCLSHVDTVWTDMRPKSLREVSS